MSRCITRLNPKCFSMCFGLISILFFHTLLVSGQTILPGPPVPVPPGKLVDIGGYTLHLHATGSGKPPVVLIAGSLGFSFDWTLVQDKLSAYALVCSYDRPGLAWSDPGPMPRTLKQDAYELQKLLKTANVKPPYILVGHSIGGIIARKFARAYPDEVSGIVLVDATSENTLLNVNGKIERLRLSASPEKPIPPLKEQVDTFTKIPTVKEIEDLWGMIGKPTISPPFDRLPKRVQQTRLWAQSQPKYYIADSGEYWAEEFAEMYADSLSYKLGSKPLIILCSTKNEYPRELGQETIDRLMADKLQNQHRFLSLSTNSKLITTANSGHEIQLTEPDLVVEAVRQIISALK